MDALRSNDDLLSAMNGIIRYSTTVVDVSVTDAHGFTMLSTDPDAINQRAAYRDSFARLRDGSVFQQVREVFGAPRVLDIAEPLDRNGMPFLVVHVGVRSTFLRFALEPWLRAALEFVLLAILASVAAAALLSTVALRPLKAIGEQLERLTLTRGDAPRRRATGAARKAARSSAEGSRPHRPRHPHHRPPWPADAQPRRRLHRAADKPQPHAGHPARRRVAVCPGPPRRNGFRRGSPLSPAPGRRFAGLRVDDMVGKRLEEIFAPETTLGAAVLAAFARGAQISAETVTLEDGRQVQLSLDRIGDDGTDRPGEPHRSMGTLVTLRDTGTALELEQELEVARRLAAIGRLTANVGHEVKNPINAMVVHLELLRGKLAAGAVERESAQKHVDILADEMHRLDRVVETLADFSRPMELDLREHDLRRVVEQTLELAGAELKEHGVTRRARVAAVARARAGGCGADAPGAAEPAAQCDAGDALRRRCARRPCAATSGSRSWRSRTTAWAFPHALLPRIFDLYFTTKPKGSGIGLAMTYRILQLHGGAMEVRSNADPASPERGTTFTLNIPLSTAPAGRRPQAGATRKRFRRPPACGRRRTCQLIAVAPAGRRLLGMERKGIA